MSPLFVTIIKPPPGWNQFYLHLHTAPGRAIAIEGSTDIYSTAHGRAIAI